jgi:glyoxylase-like metal-dependent hydrolase (beta-lactamase superfamily II)
VRRGGTPEGVSSGSTRNVANVTERYGPAPPSPPCETSPVGALRRWSVGDVTLTRVAYFDVDLPPDAVRLSPDEVAHVPWREPWVGDTGTVRVGQAFWMVESGDRTLVVDPCGASDAFLRSGPDAVTHQEAALGTVSAAGFDLGSVEAVVLSHLDGIGMAAVVTDDGWAPAFPGADLVVTADERTTIAARPDISGSAAFEALAAAGAVRTVEPPAELAPGVTMVATGGHSAGHAVITISSRGEHAVMLGHLAVSPLHTVTGPCLGLHEDPVAAWVALGGWLRWAADHGALVLGPLWPDPGAARVDGLDPAVLTPASV